MYDPCTDCLSLDSCEDCELVYMGNKINQLLERLKYARRFLKPVDHDTAWVDEVLK